MATLAEIKAQLGIQNLKLTPINGNADFLSYKDDEKGIIVIIHKNLAQQLQQTPQIDNLTFDTSTKSDELKNYTVYKIIENIPAYHDEKIKQPSINIDGISSKLKLDRLSNNEIIVMSVVVGTIIALIIGFAFENYYYYHNGLKLYSDDKNDYAEFNYLASVASFIISGGITYLFLKRKNKMQ